MAEPEDMDLVDSDIDESSDDESMFDSSDYSSISENEEAFIVLHVFGVIPQDIISISSDEDDEVFLKGDSKHGLETESKVVLHSPGTSGTQSQSGINDDLAHNPSWVNLPDVAIIKVMTHLLDDKSRWSAAMTCKRWLNLFHTPSLWRRRCIRFDDVAKTDCVTDGFARYDGGISCRRKYNRVVGFARAHGSHLQYLRITCLRPAFFACKWFQRTLEDVFCHLNKTRYGVCELKEFIMPHLQMDRYWRFAELRHKLVKCLVGLLKRQHCIASYDMTRARFFNLPGTAVLEAMARGSGRTLEFLNMEDYFQTRLAPYKLVRFQNVMNKFQNLQRLYTNYNYFSEEIMEGLGKSCSRKLKCITLKVVRLSPTDHILSDDAWKALKTQCPDLEVYVDIEDIGAFAQVARLLSQEMPLTNLQLWSGIPMPGQGPWRLDLTLYRIGAKFGHCIDSLLLMFDNCHESIDEALLNMLPRCRRLETLTLEATLQIQTIDAIYRLQREYKTGLLHCSITLDNLSMMEKIELDTVNELYEEMVEERALDFEIQPYEFIEYY